MFQINSSAEKVNSPFLHLSVLFSALEMATCSRKGNLWHSVYQFTCLLFLLT
jgi:hypothetical protein